MTTTSFVTRYRPAKRWFAAVFITLYLLPFSLLFFYAMTRFRASGNVILIGAFGLPLHSIWSATLDYSWFEKGVVPFSPGLKSKIIIAGLALGIASTILCILADPLLNFVYGFQTFTGAFLAVSGFAALPGSIFAAGVLIKATKARRSARMDTALYSRPLFATCVNAGAMPHD